MELNADEQRELTSRMEQKQMRDFITMYTNFVQRCFDECIHDFTTKSLQSKEENCVMKCIDKRIKASERLGQRFAEQNMSMMQAANGTGSGN